MARRTKREMELMKNDVTFYLLENKLDPHRAHEAMIKEHLESGQPIPYYIKGVKDFIKISQQLAIELDRKEKMAKRDREKAEQKETIINYILNLSKDEIKDIYKKYKDAVSHSDKLVLHDVYVMKYTDYEMSKKDIDQHMINVFTRIYNEQLQPV
jgi:hypothetical protein